MDQQLWKYTVFLIAGIILLTATVVFLCCREKSHSRELRLLQKKKEAIEELNRQTQELAHHQRLQTIGTLTASISHEFNNLLTPIMGYSMLALEQISPEDIELYDNIMEIYESSRKAKMLVSRLSDLSRKNSETHFHPISPDELIRKTLGVVSPAIKEGIKIKLNLNCWEQRIHANEIQITQLLLNLILNGFHAMEPGGGILTISTDFDEKNICIRIEDTGCGIPDSIREKIFEPFFTTKDTGRGTGLGLAIAAQVAEDHHGSITVDSRVGEGTRFIVTLPRV